MPELSREHSGRGSHRISKADGRLSGGNEDLLVVLADKALRSTRDLRSHWSLQRRHADGRRWVEIAGFLARSDAEAGLVRAGEVVPVEELRITHVRRT